MSDIEKVMKINKMSETLKQHGFAENSEEASSQAQKVFNQKIAETKKPAEEEGQMSNEDLAKVERNFDVFKSSTTEQLNSMRDDIHKVIQKMNEMIKAITELEKLKDSVTTIDEGGPEKQQRLAPKIVKKPKEEKPANHPRVGNVQPGDIDINETFYYGTR